MTKKLLAVNIMINCIPFLDIETPVKLDDIPRFERQNGNTEMIIHIFIESILTHDNF